MPPLTPAEHVIDGLRNALIKIIDEPMTVTTLNRIERIAESGAMTLRAIGGVAEAISGIKTEQLSDGEPITTAPPAETFGARMIQELMAMVPQLMGKKNEDPRKLVDALIAARRAGMTDVAAELEVRLVGKPFSEIGAVGPVSAEDEDEVTDLPQVEVESGAHIARMYGADRDYSGDPPDDGRA
jgi:hypothetical protein